MIVDADESAAFMRKVIGVGLSAILYERRLFEERAYKTKFIGDMKVRILDDQSTAKGVKSMLGYVFSIFDAIERGYLKQVVFTFFTDMANCEDLLEAYVFKIQYRDGGKPGEIRFRFVVLIHLQISSDKN